MPWGALACHLFRILCLSENRSTAKYLSCCACCYCVCLSVTIRHSPWMQDKVHHWLFFSELWDTFCLFFFSWVCGWERERGILGQHWRVPYTPVLLSGSVWFFCWKQFLNVYRPKCVQAKCTIVFILFPFEMLLPPSRRQFLNYQLCSEALGSAGGASLLTQRLLVQKVLYAGQKNGCETSRWNPQWLFFKLQWNFSQENV